ncbi:hypothetical protein [Pseudoalteromonas luteoviolacea]|uniref:hypothetical protein n=1 Tax=Pseudoalteromonas luteoviolacea TaxID=43657 RepID=UPI0011506380|nr:hypothetical protein [Pseudoalteromonas luteoviolacea]TQF71524.1 hypothetical protein FLM44_10705 [Pseudoalteromonas luteoviolacea]
MLKSFVVLFASFILLLLNACSEQKQQLSFEEFTESSKALNWLTQNQQERQRQLSSVMPFDDAYLKTRHELLYSIDTANLTSEQEDALDYLKIQERYPERFLVWPAYFNVLERAQGNVTDKALDEWLQLVVERLNKGRESNIVLNRLERNQLLDFLETSHYGSEQKNALTRFLRAYKVRSNIGLHQLPNGKEWYQSKMNFYLGQAVDPNELLTALSKQAERVPGEIEVALTSHINISKPVVLEMVERYCDAKEGYNWRDGYIDIKQTLLLCKQDIPESVYQWMVTVVQVDVGIHLYAWSQQQAMHRLQSRLALNDVQAYAILKNIVFHPATSMAILPNIKAFEAL